MEKSQREFVLRRSSMPIRKELGEDGESDEIARYRERITETPLPEEARKEAERELTRLETGAQAPRVESAPTSTGCCPSRGARPATSAATSTPRARDPRGRPRRHRGRQGRASSSTWPSASSRRATREIEDEQRAPILALVGPPGVGKTSLGESIARALGRKFVRMSLGGVRDEAEIRGHRRTYVGALPGRLVRALRDAGTMNPVILLDEIDKLGSDCRGDPSSGAARGARPGAELTRSATTTSTSTSTSRDVLFIATANVADTIPGPLLDRLE